MLLLLFFLCLCLVALQPFVAAETQWNYADVLNEYVAGRPEFPAQIFEPLKQFVSQNPSVLDVNCRTGISTRQLEKMGFKNVTGCFGERALIEKARELSPKDIKYVEADITKSLPFKDQQFKLVVTFNDLAFLSEGNSLKELARVMEPNGYFFAVYRGKKGGSSKNASYQILIDEFGVLPPSDTATDESTFFTTEDTLKNAGFVVIEKTTIPVTNYRTKEQMVNHTLSISPWISAKKMATKEQWGRLLKKLNASMDERLADSEKPGFIKSENVYTTWLVQKPAAKQ